MSKLIFLILAPLLRLFCSERADVWLVGENRGRLSYDNGFYFYRYSVRQRNGVYLVVLRSHFEGLRNEKNVLVYGSLRHAYILAVAGLLVYSHTHRDVMYGSMYRLLGKGRKCIYLKHGVTAFKAFNEDYRSRSGEIDALVSVSDREKTVIAQGMGIAAEKIAVTGFPRYDGYSPDRSPDSIVLKKILYMPTWRDWLNQENFGDSRLFEESVGLLRSRGLCDILESNDCELSFILHINMRQHVKSYVREFSSRVKILQAEQIALQDLIIESDLLITDYSSVAWDFLYCGKPVIFFQPDLDTYLFKRGACIDMGTAGEMFGVSTEDANAVVEQLQVMMGKPYKLSAHDQALRSKWFQYTDQDNCKRVFALARQL